MANNPRIKQLTYLIDDLGRRIEELQISAKNIRQTMAQAQVEADELAHTIEQASQVAAGSFGSIESWRRQAAYLTQLRQSRDSILYTQKEQQVILETILKETLSAAVRQKGFESLRGRLKMQAVKEEMQAEQKHADEFASMRRYRNRDFGWE